MGVRVVAAAVALTAAAAAPAADLVASLPGLGGNGKTPTPWYSGYLDVAGTSKHLHYTFVASPAGAGAPLVAWFNGGPGCSSLEGLFAESGPLHVNGATPGTNPTSPPSLYVNPNTWGNFSHSLFIEAPACVGFSYADNLADCAANDTTSGVDNLKALLDFYAKFPEYAGNDLFIAGESYAGIYVPTLGARVVQHNKANPGSAIPLKGIAVGNGVLGEAWLNPTKSGFSYPRELQVYIPFFRSHSLVSKQQMAAIDAACPDVNDPAPGQACHDAIEAAHDAIGNVDVYNVYAACELPNASSAYSRAPGQSSRAVGGYGPVECVGGYALSDYLNQPSVVQALHVAPGLAGSWSVCSSNRSFAYTRTEQDQRFTNYPVLFEAGIPVLVLSGEADACIPWIDTELWTSSLNLTVTDAWRSWTFNNGNQVAGYTISYDSGYGSHLTFATVLEAGHMVPEYAPAQSWTMISRFVAGQPL